MMKSLAVLFLFTFFATVHMSTHLHLVVASFNENMSSIVNWLLAENITYTLYRRGDQPVPMGLNATLA
jgi:hypothetical protein